MAYFPNSTAWECWAPDNCFKCAHWPQSDDDPGCPIDMLHNVYNYDQCSDDSLKSVLDSLIPMDGIHAKQCAMFLPINEAAVARQRQEREDRVKYEAAMAEMRA